MHRELARALVGCLLGGALCPAVGHHAALLRGSPLGE